MVGKDEWIAVLEMFYVHSRNALGCAKGFGLRLGGRWNQLVSHHDDSETGNCIMNVRKEKTL